MFSKIETARRTKLSKSISSDISIYSSIYRYKFPNKVGRIYSILYYMKFNNVFNFIYIDSPRSKANVNGFITTPLLSSRSMARNLSPDFSNQYGLFDPTLLSPRPMSRDHQICTMILVDLTQVRVQHLQGVTAVCTYI